jgi:hypothetical protein
MSHSKVVSSKTFNINNTVNTKPRNSLIELPFKTGFDGVLSKSDKLSILLKVLHPKDNKQFLMAHIRRYYHNKERYHTGIYLTEYEYNQLIDILAMAKKDKAENQVFEKNTETRQFKVTLVGNGAMVHQQSNGKNRYLKLSGKQCARLVRKYARFDHFIQNVDNEGESDGDSDSEGSDDSDDQMSETEQAVGYKPADFTPSYSGSYLSQTKKQYF